MKIQVAVLTVFVSTLVVACSAVPAKSQRDMDTDACAYGAQVPRNFETPKARKDYIDNIAIPACLRAKGYTD